MAVSDASCLRARDSDAINRMLYSFRYSDVVKGGLDYEYVDER